MRITNHQSNTNTYILHDANYEYNLSIVITRKRRRNSFIPNDDVKLDEFVYYGANLQKVESPLSKIAEGLIEYLETGKYEDKTGIALPNISPQPIENKVNCNINTKQVIRLTEGDLRNMVKNCINEVLNEAYNGDLYHYTDFEKGMSIIKQNDLIADINDSHNDSSLDDLKYNTYNGSTIPSLSFTRQPNPIHFIGNGGGSYGDDNIAVRFTLDSNKIMSSLRYAILKPYRWHGCQPQKSEFEERLYGVDVYPLDKYCKQVDLYIYDMTEAEDYIYELFYDKAKSLGYTEENDEFFTILNQLAIDYITKESKFKDKVIVHDMRKKKKL